MVYFMFGLMMTIAAGVDSAPVISFLASLIHFGISSWLFLFKNKLGRIINLFTSIALLIWPTFAFIGSVVANEAIAIIYYFVIILFVILASIVNIKSFDVKSQIESKVKFLMSAIPLLLLLIYIGHIIQMIQQGWITLGGL